MVSPDITVLRAMERLSANADFRCLTAWIGESLKESIEQLLVSASTVSVHQCQGYASALTDILQSVTTAREAIASLG